MLAYFIGFLALLVCACGTGGEDENSSSRNRSGLHAPSEGCEYSNAEAVPTGILERVDREGRCGVERWEKLPAGACEQTGVVCATVHTRECRGAGVRDEMIESPLDGWVCECDGTWACWMNSVAASPCDVLTEAEDGGAKGDGGLGLEMGGANCAETRWE